MSILKPPNSDSAKTSSYGVLFQKLQNLMRYRIRDVLLVSSMYDLYVFEEDGRLYEMIRDEYKGLNLSHAPELTRVSTAQEALELAAEEKRFDLILTTPHIDDLHVGTFAKMVRNADLNIPIVLLAYDYRELSEVLGKHDPSLFDRIFVWQGDFRIMIAIIKHIEDSLNVEHDTLNIGVQVIILVEDSVRDYSTFLPIIYTELFQQSQRLIAEGINLSDRYLRMRARPKILLCNNYEDAWYNYQRYKDHILGIISDIDFERDGKQDPRAGLIFANNVKEDQDDIPILLQSQDQKNKEFAHDVGASFLLKDSPTLLLDLRRFMVNQFGFGDFVFRTEDLQEVGNARNLYELEEMLRRVPDESIRYHANGNHFSKWLKARTEFWVAHKLRPRKVSEFDSIDELRQILIDHLQEYRRNRQRGSITDFHKPTFDPETTFARIGGGSLGGKARGLSFVNYLITNFGIQSRFKKVHIHVPAGVVLATEVFDEFLEINGLRAMALSNASDEVIHDRFVSAYHFPQEAEEQLASFLELVDAPLAVRSSSLLEDSQYHPFAGVYETYMLPNVQDDPEVRLQELINAVKSVYASTFFKRVKDYIRITSYRLEEEKMAVIIQRVVGGRYGDRYYPQFAGAAKSYNFYPVAPQESADGTVSLVLGLGKMVADGGNCIKFSPKYPNHVPQLSTIDQALKSNQNEFFAINLDAPMDGSLESYQNVVESFNLRVAEKDGSLFFSGSTYSHENNQIYNGISRPGARLVTFAPILESKIFPLPEILRLLLEIGRRGMGTPVEIEFAVNMDVPKGEPKQFGVLQLRPLVLNQESVQLSVSVEDESSLICRSAQVLGNGIIEEIYDVVFVDNEIFERSRSREVADEVSRFNGKLMNEKRPYLLVGVGRWGTLDPWLGIPVKWEQICGARLIVEAGFKDFDVTPSQGSHFFQNLTSFMVGYFTVSNLKDIGQVDWDWLRSQKPLESMTFTRHLRFDSPISARMNGHKQKGIIFKPGRASGNGSSSGQG